VKVGRLLSSTVTRRSSTMCLIPLPTDPRRVQRVERDIWLVCVNILRLQILIDLPSRISSTWSSTQTSNSLTIPIVRLQELFRVRVCELSRPCLERIDRGVAWTLWPLSSVVAFLRCSKCSLSIEPLLDLYQLMTVLWKPTHCCFLLWNSLSVSRSWPVPSILILFLRLLRVTNRDLRWFLLCGPKDRQERFRLLALLIRLQAREALTLCQLVLALILNRDVDSRQSWDSHGELRSFSSLLETREAQSDSPLQIFRLLEPILRIKRHLHIVRL